MIRVASQHSCLGCWSALCLAHNVPHEQDYLKRQRCCDIISKTMTFCQPNRGMWRTILLWYSKCWRRLPMLYAKYFFEVKMLNSKKKSRVAMFVRLELGRTLFRKKGRSERSWKIFLCLELVLACCITTASSPGSFIEGRLSGKGMMKVVTVFKNSHLFYRLACLYRSLVSAAYFTKNSLRKPIMPELCECIVFDEYSLQ